MSRTTAENLFDGNVGDSHPKTEIYSVLRVLFRSTPFKIRCFVVGSIFINMIHIFSALFFFGKKPMQPTNQHDSEIFWVSMILLLMEISKGKHEKIYFLISVFMIIKLSQLTMFSFAISLSLDMYTTDESFNGTQYN